MQSSDRLIGKEADKHVTGSTGKECQVKLADHRLTAKTTPEPALKNKINICNPSVVNVL